MADKGKILKELRGVDAIRAIAWAYNSAVARTLDDHSELAGYNAQTLGTTRYVLFCDRLDRVFSCGRYAAESGVDTSTGADILRAELSDEEWETMPVIPAGTVVRSNINGSDGWRIGNRRYLIQAGKFGKLSDLHWAEKSPTKQAVARRPDPDSSQMSLAELVSPEEMEAWSHLLQQIQADDLDTLIIAHSLDALQMRGELVLGRPQFNLGGGKAWHWQHNLLAGEIPPQGKATKSPKAPDPTGDVPDAPVRLRPKSEEQQNRRRGTDV